MILIIDMTDPNLRLSKWEFVDPIAQIVTNIVSVTVCHYEKYEESMLEKYDGVILSGTALKDYRYLDNPKDFEWISKSEKPLLGICAGMQIIGITYGCRLRDNKYIGLTKVRTSLENKLFNGEFEAYNLRGKDLELSDEVIELAKSDDCIQAIKHKSKPHYGVLFHPEVRNAEIVKNFIKLIND